MFSGETQRALRREADTILHSQGLIREASDSCNPLLKDLIEVDSNDEFFEALYDANDKMENPVHGTAINTLARAALLEAPLLHPANPVRCIAGAAYSFRAFNHPDSRVDSFLHQIMYGRALSDAIPGLNKSYLGIPITEAPSKTEEERLTRLYSDYFSIAEILDRAGVNALSNLSNRYNVDAPWYYPTHMMIDQLNAPLGAMPEVAIYTVSDKLDSSDLHLDP